MDDEIKARNAAKLHSILEGHKPLGKPNITPDTTPRPLTTLAALNQAEKTTKQVERAEEEWVERHMKSTGCDRQTAKTIYRDGLNRGHEVVQD